jgi:hypothetical protein
MPSYFQESVSNSGGSATGGTSAAESHGNSGGFTGEQGNQGNQGGTQQGNAETLTPEQIAELRTAADKYNKFAPFLQTFEQAGLTDAQALQARIQSQEHQQSMAAQESQLASKYQARIDAGELTPEQAEEMFNLEWAQTQMRTQLQQFSHMSLQNQVETVTNQFPELKAPGMTDILRTLHLATNQPVPALAEYLSGMVKQQSEAAVAAYAATQAKAPPAPVPGSGGGSPPPANGPQGTEHSSWAELFGITRKR